MPTSPRPHHFKLLLVLLSHEFAIVIIKHHWPRLISLDHHQPLISHYPLFLVIPGYDSWSSTPLCLLLYSLVLLLCVASMLMPRERHQQKHSREDHPPLRPTLTGWVTISTMVWATNCPAMLPMNSWSFTRESGWFVDRSIFPSISLSDWVVTMDITHLWSLLINHGY